MRTKRRGLRTVCTVHAVQRTIEGRARQQIPNLEAARTRGFPSRDRDASRSRCIDQALKLSRGLGTGATRITTRGKRGVKSSWRSAHLAVERLRLQRYFDYNSTTSGRQASAPQFVRLVAQTMCLTSDKPADMTRLERYSEGCEAGVGRKVAVKRFQGILYDSSHPLLFGTPSQV